MSISEPLVVLAGLVMSTLVAAVGYLFRAFENSKQTIEKELTDCQEDRLKLWERISGIEKSVASQNE